MDQPLPKSNNIQEEEEEDYAGTIDMQAYLKETEEDEEGTIDMEAYAKSKEAQESTWWDVAKDVGIQSVKGVAQAYTYPLDIFKALVVAQGLEGAKDVEEEFREAGIPFDKDKYIQTVMKYGEFIPTQELLEKVIEKKTGTTISDPKTKPGKFFNKLFFLGSLAKGKGLTKAGAARGAKAGVAGALTKTALEEAGAPELIADIAGDIAGGAAGAFTKQPRKFSPQAKKIIDTAEKHGLPLMEFMVEDTVHPKARISAKRKAAFESDIKMTTEEAINNIIEEKIPVAKLRSKGKDLEILKDDAYKISEDLAKKNPSKIDTKDIISEIDKKISEIKNAAPMPSDSELESLKILEKVKIGLGDKTYSAEQMINQTRKYNKNVTRIYKKSEFRGSEEEIANTYAFINKKISESIEKYAGKDVANAHRAANKIFAYNKSLYRTEGLLTQAFKDEKYSAKKLNQLLNSKKGAILRRDIGEEGVKDLRRIAEYGEKAQRATNQFSKSAKHGHKLESWGKLAFYTLGKKHPMVAGSLLLNPALKYYKGWALTRPVARKAYADILENAAKGSFKNMSKDFSKLEDEVIKEYGSVDEFVKKGIEELQMYREGEEDKD